MSLSGIALITAGLKEFLSLAKTPTSPDVIFNVSDVLKPHSPWPTPASYAWHFALHHISSNAAVSFEVAIIF
jgi:hypothetical protein